MTHLGTSLLVMNPRTQKGRHSELICDSTVDKVNCTILCKVCILAKIKLDPCETGDPVPGAIARSAYMA